MQQIDKEAGRLGLDEDLSTDGEVPDALDYWSIDEFSDVLPSYAAVVENI